MVWPWWERIGCAAMHENGRSFTRLVFFDPGTKGPDGLANVANAK